LSCTKLLSQKFVWDQNEFLLLDKARK
jgi:hypothetical protein